MLCRRISCLVSWTNQSYVNLSWSILIKTCLARIETIAALRAQGRDCTNSSSTWLNMLPQDCSCFHSGHYIICWQVPLKNEFTTLAKNVDITSGRSLAAARASDGSLVRACMLYMNQFRNSRHPMAMKRWSRVTFRLLTDNLMIY